MKETLFDKKTKYVYLGYKQQTVLDLINLSTSSLTVKEIIMATNYEKKHMYGIIKQLIKKNKIKVDHSVKDYRGHYVNTYSSLDKK